MSIFQRMVAPHVNDADIKYFGCIEKNYQLGVIVLCV